MKKLVYHVPDMHCSNCALRLEGLEDSLPGVQRVEASYHRQQVTVEFDECQVGEGDIVAAAGRLGYTLVREER